MGTKPTLRGQNLRAVAPWGGIYLLAGSQAQGGSFGPSCQPLRVASALNLGQWCRSGGSSLVSLRSSSLWTALYGAQKSSASCLGPSPRGRMPSWVTNLSWLRPAAMSLRPVHTSGQIQVIQSDIFLLVLSRWHATQYLFQICQVAIVFTSVTVHGNAGTCRAWACGLSKTSCGMFGSFW